MQTSKPKPKKPGRPRLPKGNAKAIMLRVRVTPDEQRAIERAAKSSSEKPSEWIRRSLEEAQVVKVMVRITDAAENKYDWFIGPPQECPPLPRIGEFVAVSYTHLARFAFEPGRWSKGPALGNAALCLP